MTNDDTTTENKIEVVALSEANTKQEIYDHLSVYHFGSGFRCAGHWVYNVGTKATKADLLKLHDQAHVVLDDPERTHRYRAEEDGAVITNTWYAKGEQEGYYTSTVTPEIDHIHSLVPAAPLVDPKMRDMADKLISGEERITAKPLSAGERKVLTELINNDFATLKSEMSTFAADSLQATQTEIHAEYDKVEKSAARLAKRATDMLHRHQKEAQALGERHRKEFEDLHELATEASVDLRQSSRTVLDAQGNNRQELFYQALAIGRAEALQQATAENRSAVQRAQANMEQQRLAAQRSVLLSGVTVEASAILDSIPDAKTLMVNAAAAEAAKAIEAKASEANS